MQHRPITLRMRGRDDYSAIIQKPLSILAMLVPLILAYEVGSRLFLSSVETAGVQSIRAHSLLLAFFQDLGIAGRSFPSIALVSALLVWHIVSNERWRIRAAAVLGMYGESLALTMPLVVFFGLIQLALGGPGAPPPAVQTDPSNPLAALPWQAAAVVSIGAGIYEEFLFRLIGVSALRLILIDLGRISPRTGTAIAVVLAAAAFAAYHDVSGPGGGVDAFKAASFLAAGLYFGSVFVMRGFGVAVGVHVMYDVCALILAGKASA